MAVGGDVDVGTWTVVGVSGGERNVGVGTDLAGVDVGGSGKGEVGVETGLIGVGPGFSGEGGDVGVGSGPAAVWVGASDIGGMLVASLLTRSPI